MRIVEPIESVKHDFFGVTLEIARAHSAKHIAATRIAADGITAEGENGDHSQAQYRQINATAMAGTVLVGWEGFVSDGVEIPYSADNARELMLDDDYAYEFVMKHGMDQDQFFRRSSEDSKKKLSSVSGGN